MTASRARVVHTVIALVVVAALVLQLVLVLDGAPEDVETLKNARLGVS